MLCAIRGMGASPMLFEMHGRGGSCYEILRPVSISSPFWRIHARLQLLDHIARLLLIQPHGAKITKEEMRPIAFVVFQWFVGQDKILAQRARSHCRTEIDI